MRIVQTFWTAKADLTRSTFGWTNPEYNLMAWTLSCLSLRRYYKDVVLYTDKEGYHILIEKLGLPYTDVVIMYENLLCLPTHWGYPKILTYLFQKEPFLHIDGDVFINKQLPCDIMKATLITQNKEISSDYYRNMVNRIVNNKNVTLPVFFDPDDFKTGIPSYNMGVFGGSDLAFIKYYCTEAIDFIEKNQLNNPKSANANMACNVFFEQIFLAILAEKSNKKITTLLNQSIRDNGYMLNEFCDLWNYTCKPFFHIIGGHKKNAEVCRALENILKLYYPVYYKKIISLLPDRYAGRFEESKHTNKTINENDLMKEYYLHIEKNRIIWEDIELESQLDWEIKNANSQIRWKKFKKEKKEELFFEQNEHMSIFLISSAYSEEEKKEIVKRLNCEDLYPLEQIAIIPSSKRPGYIEVPLLDNEKQIILNIQNGQNSFKSIVEFFNDKYLSCDKRNLKAVNILIYQSIDTLLYSGIISISTTLTEETLGSCDL